ncbi:MAG: nucleoporin [Candidatus Paceibacterota bacterium]
MQNNGNKLRAFIITFIVMGILIAIGYFIFKNAGTDNTTRGESIGKKFTSLFGQSKQLPADKIDDVDTQNNTNNTDPNQTDQTAGNGSTGSNTDGTSNTGSTGSQNNGQSTANNGLSNTIIPKLNPFPYGGSGTYGGGLISGGGVTGGGFIGGGGFTGGDSGFTGGGTNGGGDTFDYGDLITSKPECSDGIDNDGDGKKDSADSGCHTDLKASNAYSYFPGWDDEQSENDITVDDKKNMCEVNIIFNDTDKKRMEELTRLFYRLAPNLATAEDIKLEVANQKTYENVINKSKEYTAQCYKERETLGPSRALSNGKDYMLESRDNGYANLSKIKPSETFLPGDKGASFETPYITVTDSYRNRYFQEHGDDLIINTAITKQKDRGGAAGAVAAHILQNMHDYGIIKRYIPDQLAVPMTFENANIKNPDGIYNYKGDENYQKVLDILLRETGQYLDALEPGRREWSDRSGRNETLETFIGFVQVVGSDYWGYINTKEALNLYLISGATDDTRKVDFGKITWFSGASEFENKPKNAYKNFEDAFMIW